MDVVAASADGTKDGVDILVRRGIHGDPEVTGLIEREAAVQGIGEQEQYAGCGQSLPPVVRFVRIVQVIDDGHVQ